MQQNQPRITYDLRQPADVAQSGALLETVREYFDGTQLPYLRRLSRSVALQHQPVVTAMFLHFIDTLHNVELFQEKTYQSDESGEEHTWLFGVNRESLIQFNIGGNEADLQITGKDQKKVAKYTENFSKWLNKIDLKQSGDDLTLQIYYFDSSEGSSFFKTKIIAPDWNEIADNYVGTTRQALNKIFTEDAIKGTGLMIWSGDSGTGKTYAIRALMQRWKDYYRCVSVSDFDTFLEQPSYYYSIADYGEKPALIILEDAVESLLQASREKHSGRISKLLNMTDGLLSQGREDLFLVTFNEDIKKLDSAVTRPGRCLSRIIFNYFSSKEAGIWLEDHDAAQNVINACLRGKTPKSLAELYHIYDGGEEFDIQGKGEVGFG